MAGVLALRIRRGCDYGREPGAVGMGMRRDWCAMFARVIMTPDMVSVVTVYMHGRWAMNFDPALDDHGALDHHGARIVIRVDVDNPHFPARPIKAAEEEPG